MKQLGKDNPTGRPFVPSFEGWTVEDHSSLNIGLSVDRKDIRAGETTSASGICNARGLAKLGETQRKLIKLLKLKSLFCICLF